MPRGFYAREGRHDTQSVSWLTAEEAPLFPVGVGT